MHTCVCTCHHMSYTHTCYTCTCEGMVEAGILTQSSMWPKSIWIELMEVCTQQHAGYGADVLAMRAYADAQRGSMRVCSDCCPFQLSHHLVPSHPSRTSLLRCQRQWHLLCHRSTPIHTYTRIWTSRIVRTCGRASGGWKHGCCDCDAAAPEGTIDVEVRAHSCMHAACQQIAHSCVVHIRMLTVCLMLSFSS